MPDAVLDAKEPGDSIREVLRKYWKPFLLYATEREQYAILSLFGPSSGAKPLLLRLGLCSAHT